MQGGGWFEDFQKAEDMLRRAAGEAQQLKEAIERRGAESDTTPIVESLQSLLAPLNECVMQAV